MSENTNGNDLNKSNQPNMMPAQVSSLSSANLNMLPTSQQIQPPSTQFMPSFPSTTTGADNSFNNSNLNLSSIDANKNQTLGSKTTDQNSHLNKPLNSTLLTSNSLMLNNNTQQQQQQQQQQFLPPSQTPFLPPPMPYMDPYMFNQSFTSQASSTLPNSKTIPSNLGSSSGVNTQSINKQATNAIPNSISTQNALNSVPIQQSQLNAASAAQVPFMPYMDPYQMQMYQMYQMYQMAQMGPFGYAGMNPYMSQYSPFPFMGPQQLPDDQRSMQSYHYFDDTRSEKKLNLTTHQRAESLAGDFKHEPAESKLKNLNAPFSNNNAPGGLLMKDTSQNQNMPSELNLETTSSMGETLQAIKRDENRLTPPLHPLPHVRACFSLNSLVQIKANDPCEGQPALVDIFNLTEVVDQYLINPKIVKFSTDDDDDQNSNGISSEMREKLTTDYKLLQEFPGPLVKEHSSKAQIIQFCQKNIRECLSNANVNLIDPQSHALLWDFLALLVRQNGIVDLKTDISALLLSGIVDTQNQWTLSTASATITNSNTTTSNRPISNSASSTSSLFAMQQQQQDFVLIGNEDTAQSDTGVTNSTLIVNEPKASNNNYNNYNNNNNTINSSKQNSRLTPISSDSSFDESHLNKLRQLLGAGQKGDAIELAVKYNMWPHALFLASSINGITNAPLNVPVPGASSSGTAASGLNEKYKALNKVKNRFINSLQPNDPIHTCYQLLVGRIPTIATNISKSEWTEWRRHLAMIVANIDETNKDLVMNSIKTMGDTLASNGRVAASHFCYLLSDCQFGTYNKKSSKLVLIGSSQNQEFSKFCQINAIQATEIFEFANSLSPSSNTAGLTSSLSSISSSSSLSSSGILEHFVKYKLIYASRLLEYGFVSEAYKYIEVIAKAINLNPKLHQDKMSSVFQLANRLRIYDSDFNVDDLSLQNSEPQWLQDLNNNYKKLHLNKLWHLLPSKESPVEKSVDPGSIQQKNIATINVVAKVEPQTPSSSNSQQFQSDPSFSNKPNVNNSVPVQELDGLNLDLKNINLNSTYNDTSNQYNTQQHQFKTAPILTENSVSQVTDYSNNYDSAKRIDSRRYATDDINLNNENQNWSQNPETNQIDYQQNQQPHQPLSQQQQQNQPHLLQRQYSNNSTRKSSASSIMANEPTSLPAGIHSTQVTPMANSSNLNRGSYPRSSLNNLNTPSNNIQRGTTPGTNDQFQVSNSADANRYARPRSRQNSGNVMPPMTFTPFNPYQQQQQQQNSSAPQNRYESNDSPFYDPNSKNFSNNNSYGTPQIPKSQTFPAQKIKEEGNENDQYNVNRDNSKNNLQQTQEDDEEDEEFSTSNKKSRKNKENSSKNDDKMNPQNNQSLLWRAINYIKPASGPKRMVLPDDKKKTIVWDDKLKRYVNQDGSSDPVASIKPPPTFIPPSSSQQSTLNNDQQQIQNLAPSTSNQPHQQAPPSNDPKVNRFSIKSQNTSMRNYYAKVDVLADQSKKLNAPNVDQQLMAPPPMLSNMPPPSQLPPRFFVPPPLEPSQNQPQEVQQSNSNITSQQAPQTYQPQQSSAQQSAETHYQYQTNQPQYTQQEYYQPQQSSTNNYQHQNDNNTFTDENDSGTNSTESSTGSSQQSYSNESNSGYQHQQYYAQNQDLQDQYYQHHSNI